MKNDRIWTIIELINWGQDYLGTKGIENPRLNMELMLTKILSCSRIDLYLKFDMPLDKAQLNELHNFVLRRSKNEPLQYILGEAPFCGLFFNCDSRALIPRPETEILFSAAVNYVENLKKDNVKILEIGTGSGILAISLALRFPSSEITAIDISPAALALAEENARKFDVKNIKFYRCDFLKERPAGIFDLLVSNPPYIPMDKIGDLSGEIKAFEPIEALTDNSDGLTFYRRFAELSRELVCDGRMFLEIDGRNTDEVSDVFNKELFNLEVIKDFNGLDRIVKIKNRNTQ